MELHLIILSFGLTIVALSLMFFLHAITSITCFKKSINANLYFLYCICLFIIGITMLSISVNPENEQNLIEKFKNIIYNVNDNYSPNNQENEDNNLNDNDDIDIDIDHNENNDNNENIDDNDNHKKNENNKEKNDNKRNKEMNDIEIKGENFNDNNNIYDDEKIDNNNDNKEFNEPLNDKDIKEKKNQYIIRNASFNPGKFIIFNFAKFWIKFANFLKFCGRKVVKLILFNKKE